MLLTSSYVEDDSSSYEGWPVDRDQLMYSFNTYPVPIPPGIGDDYMVSGKFSLEEYQLPQSENDIYTNWIPLPEDDAGYLYINQQMSQNPYFIKQDDEYLPDSSLTTYISGYPATTYDFGYGLESSTIFPQEFTHVTQAQLPLYGIPYSEPYCYKSEQWDPEDSLHFVAMPGLISSATSVASLSPPDKLSWQDGSFTGTPYSEDGEELLQGLGLYDCPDLAMDDVQSDIDPRQYGLGKGLKLEESFQLDEDCFSEDEEDE